MHARSGMVGMIASLALVSRAADGGDFQLVAVLGWVAWTILARWSMAQYDAE